MGSCMRRTFGATSVTVSVAGSCSCLRARSMGHTLVARRTQLDRSVKDGAPSGGAKNGRAVVRQLGHALSDVFEGPVARGLLRGGRQGLRVPAPAQLLDGRHVDRAVVEVVLDGRQVGGQEP